MTSAELSGNAKTATPSGTAPLPLSDAVQEALAITKRGVDELLIESEFAQKLARSEQSGSRCASSWAWTRPHPTCTWATPWC
jgi:tyrosyl-tRNA synthetase